MKQKPSTVSPQFKALRWRLLLSYLVVMIAIWIISDVLVYQFFARSLYQQLDNRLFNLAQAATHSLLAIKNDPKAVNNSPYRALDEDGDLDLPWQNLRHPHQGVEWFGDDRQRLAHSGTLKGSQPLIMGFQTVQGGQVRTLTLSAYHDPDEQKHLEGYVRVSESTASVEAVLARLRLESALGGLIALGLISVGGMWLTRQSLKPIEQSFWQLKQFTADASHELRSPLTAIKTSAEILQTHGDRLPREDLSKVEIILCATDQMSELVEDLLLLARMDGKPVISQQKWQKIPLIELLDDVVEFLEPIAEAKNIALSCHFLAEVTVQGDSHQLLRLFSNLVDNGLQYTPRDGKVTVSLTQSDKWAVVSVDDTGIGIAPEHLPYVFDRLWRAESARTYRPQGSGLGLAIARAIAHYHGGEITVNSQLGLGSRFQVRLPLMS
ncbi:histidine kinase [Rippkaea orientalis PCC 8801]|uniref:histidine kinase n=1 Tax=Rippkaea orientalis (strain PCC 8801 / RF-1) TaxID=41431 RepID=B7K697_RIPO1|nr:HAMP domain-containing sensor histidine kinase [Rippkaea orientalis]ACK68150.1 histidine kinase [Rippkaea orientalis PCC 8801]